MIGGHTGRNSAVLLGGALALVALLGLGTKFWRAGDRAEDGQGRNTRPEAVAAPVGAGTGEAAPAEKAARKPREKGKAAEARSEAAEAVGSATATEAERELFRLQQENVRLRARLDDMLNWILDNVRGNYLLPEEQMANLRIRPLDEDGGVSGDLENVLRLNDREMERMESAFGESRDVLQALANEGIFVSEPEEFRAVLNIPPYADGGEVVRAELYKQLQQTLGKARFDRFLQVAGAGLDEQFGHFGGEDRTVEFEAFEDEESGEEQLYVRDERAVPDEFEEGRVNVTSIERIVSRLPEEYYGYSAWLPDYVMRFVGDVP